MITGTNYKDRNSGWVMLIQQTRANSADFFKSYYSGLFLWFVLIVGKLKNNLPGFLEVFLSFLNIPFFQCDLAEFHLAKWQHVFVQSNRFFAKRKKSHLEKLLKACDASTNHPTSTRVHQSPWPCTLIGPPISQSGQCTFTLVDK